MREIDIEEMKGIQMDILANIDAFCREKGIRYSLAYGTLIGAVRHKGYIPWDDDIDIMMPRADYDRFLAEYDNPADIVVDLAKSSSYRELFTKVCRKGTIMVDDLLGRSEFGVNVDIFPMEGVPSVDPEKYVEDNNRMIERIASFCAYYKTASKNKLWMFCKFVVKRIVNLEFRPVVKIKAQFIDSLKKQNLENSSFTVCSVCCTPREIMGKGVLDDYMDIPFEKMVVRSIVDYDQCLSHCFGDYMQLPPEKDRVPHHHYKVYVSE